MLATFPLKGRVKTASLEKTPAIQPRLALLRHADDEVVAGHVREAAEIESIVELPAAHAMGLVAARRHAERVAHLDGLRRALPQIELIRSVDRAMHLDLNRDTRVVAGDPGEPAGIAPSIRK